MATEKKFDIVVFGATGVAGQYIVDEVSKVSTEEKLTWAVAGRNMSKLQKVLSESSKRLGCNIEETPIIIADTDSYQSLVEMSQQANIILNCVGPYQVYGEDVVKACIEGGANHLDISGEPQFLEKMQLLYNGKAKEKGVYILGAAGYGFIPNEVGLLYTRKQFDGEVAGIESFSCVHPGPKGHAFNLGTLDSILYVLANMNEAKTLRESLFPEPMPDDGYCLPKRLPVFFCKEINKWCIRSIEITSTTRTMRDLVTTKRLSKPFDYVPYFAVDSFLQLIGMLLALLIIGIMSQFSLGRSLLMKFPQLALGKFKEGGPTKEQIEGCTFSATFVAHGYKEAVKDRTDKTPDKTITTKIIGPEPGYILNAICITQCAVTLLREKDKFFHKEGGVFPPGAVYEETTLMDRLKKHNVQFLTVE